MPLLYIDKQDGQLKEIADSVEGEIGQEARVRVLPEMTQEEFENWLSSAYLFENQKQEIRKLYLKGRYAVPQ